MMVQLHRVFFHVPSVYLFGQIDHHMSTKKIQLVASCTGDQRYPTQWQLKKSWAYRSFRLPVTSAKKSNCNAASNVRLCCSRDHKCSYHFPASLDFCNARGFILVRSKDALEWRRKLCVESSRWVFPRLAFQALNYAGHDVPQIMVVKIDIATSDYMLTVHWNGFRPVCFIMWRFICCLSVWMPHSLQESFSGAMPRLPLLRGGAFLFSRIFIFRPSSVTVSISSFTRPSSRDGA